MKALLLVSMLVSLSASAMSLQVAEFEGKGATKVRAQIQSKLCRKLLCVDDEAATTVLHGKVLKKHGKTLLELELRDAKGGLLLARRVTVKGKGYTTTVDRAVRGALAASSPEDDAEDGEAEEDDEPASDSKPAPVSAAAPAPAKGSPVAAAPTKPAAATEEPAPGSGSGATGEPASPTEAAAPNEVVSRQTSEPVVDYSRRIVWLGAGAAVQSRQLAFSGLATPEIAGKRDLAIMARVSFALFPFARSGMGGLGVAASFASSVTSSPNELVARQVDVVLAYGLRLGSLPLWVRPEVGVRWHVLDGSQSVATDYRSVRAGLALEAALGPLRITAQGAYLGVIGGAGELTRRYFTRARTGPAFAAEVGLALNVVGKLDLVVAGTYDIYLHTLAAEPGDLYVARGASDGYLGGTGGLRLSF